MKKLFEIKPPKMPNFVSFEAPPQPKQQSFEVKSYDIANFSEEEAAEYAELMKSEFLKHWKQRRAEQKQGL